jgi:hypothetical protein
MHRNQRSFVHPREGIYTPTGKGLGLERSAPHAAGATFLAAFRSTRSASFTDAASGNATATSGSRATMTTSVGNRFKYFPRTPPRMSYSGRIVSLYLRDSVIFVGISLTWRRQSCRNDSDFIRIIRVSTSRCLNDNPILRPDSGSSIMAYTPTGNGLGLDSSVLTAEPPRQRSKRPCSRLISPVYQ